MDVLFLGDTELWNYLFVASRGEYGPALENQWKVMG